MDVRLKVFKTNSIRELLSVHIDFRILCKRSEGFWLGETYKNLGVMGRVVGFIKTVIKNSGQVEPTLVFFCIKIRSISRYVYVACCPGMAFVKEIYFKEECNAVIGGKLNSGGYAPSLSKH